MDETYVKGNGRWVYLYRAVDNRAVLSIIVSPCVVTAKAHTGIPNNVKKWQSPRFINTDKPLTYGRELDLLKREGQCPSHVEHRQIKYLNNVIECAHGKLKRIIGTMLGFMVYPQSQVLK
ncbi:DDE-type integrase/transposase/recombinase [Enterobacter asburiae]